MKKKILLFTALILLAATGCSSENEKKDKESYTTKSGTSYFDFETPATSEADNSLKDIYNELLVSFDKLKSFEESSDELNEALNEFALKYQKAETDIYAADIQFIKEIEALKTKLQNVDLDIEEKNDAISAQIANTIMLLEKLQTEYSQQKELITEQAEDILQ